jgi:hypothetical protein
MVQKMLKTSCHVLCCRASFVNGFTAWLRLDTFREQASFALKKTKKAMSKLLTIFLGGGKGLWFSGVGLINARRIATLVGVQNFVTQRWRNMVLPRTPRTAVKLSDHANWHRLF